LEEDEELKRLKEKKLRELLRRLRGGGEKREEKPEGVVVPLNSSNFDRVISEKKVPVIVDFWAEWCMPCRIMDPIFEKLAKDYAGRVFFAKVNVDENQDLALRYGIMGIPTYLIFKDGSPVERIVGAVGRGPLERALRKHLSS